MIKHPRGDLNEKHKAFDRIYEPIKKEIVQEEMAREVQNEINRERLLIEAARQQNRIKVSPNQQL